MSALDFSSIRLRPVTPDDLEFMADLYASTRSEEMRLVDWSDEEKRTFLRSQFDAQTAHYAKHYSQAERWIIEDGRVRIGRLYLNYRPDDLRIVDIVLVPDVRGRGIGGELLKKLLADATDSGRSVSIHVERDNPALHLYQRLGFEHVDEHGVYYLMKWTSQQKTAS